VDVADFDYDLPERLIAQQPARERDASRLMVLDRRGGPLEHRVFRDLPSLLRAGDLLVLNDTRVLPARLAGARPTGGPIEVLLLERVDEAGTSGDATRAVWRALSRGLGAGLRARVSFPGGLTAEFLGREPGEEVARVLLEAPGGVDRALREAGRPPTPPYVRRSPDDVRAGLDRERYQTVYAAADGAVAAPTAGLHFTRELLDAIRARGVTVETLTLHVGWGTFRPVRTDRVEDHVVDPEPCAIPERLAAAHAVARAGGGRVVAVGTTVTRALEDAAGEDGAPRPGRRRCGLFIRPGHRFRAVDALITNFHLPRSSLLMLVAAFAGRERILAAYREAIGRGYRFYSYGDAMLVI
jgi:S-adenosylmethionine:tRNA ribosyltransferase-isomerase